MFVLQDMVVGSCWDRLLLIRCPLRTHHCGEARAAAPRSRRRTCSRRVWLDSRPASPAEPRPTTAPVVAAQRAARCGACPSTDRPPAGPARRGRVDGSADRVVTPRRIHHLLAGSDGRRPADAPHDDACPPRDRPSVACSIGRGHTRCRRDRIRCAGVTRDRRRGRWTAGRWATAKPAELPSQPPHPPTTAAPSAASAARATSALLVCLMSAPPRRRGRRRRLQAETPAPRRGAFARRR